MNLPKVVLLDKVTLIACCIPYERTLYVLRIPYKAMIKPVNSTFFVPEMGRGDTIFGDLVPLDFSA